MALPMHPRTIFVAPAYNERHKIGPTVRRSKPFVDHVFIADDGSTDGSYEEAREAGADTIHRHARNRGAGAGYRAGIEYALAHKYDVLILAGGDNQDSFEDIPLLIEYVRRGWEFVQGSRYMAGGIIENQPAFRTLTTHAFTRYVNLMTGARLTDASNGFRAISLHTLRKLVDSGWVNLRQSWLDGYCLEIYLLYKLLTRPVRYTEAPVTKTYHTNLGTTKMRAFIDWWNVLKPILWLKLGMKR
jgi:dolichol-phosphate mannosyltransferase